MDPFGLSGDGMVPPFVSARERGSMHIHGFTMLVLSRNGQAVPHRQWQDTVLMAPKDIVECAFVADNPGDWMLHCHVTDHQMTGLMTIFRVT